MRSCPDEVGPAALDRLPGVNPQGCQVFSFQHPSARELLHDSLWRTTRDLPERGRIGIFNRSYYEEVLIVRVHSSILRSEGLAEVSSSDDSLWDGRYRSIVDLERHLHANGTRIVKVFLHLSKDEQRKRLLARIDELDKNWKFSAAAVEERKFWDPYMRVYGVDAAPGGPTGSTTSISPPVRSPWADRACICRRGCGPLRSCRPPRRPFGAPC